MVGLILITPAQNTRLNNDEYDLSHVCQPCDTEIKAAVRIGALTAVVWMGA